jgi:hypothetical protein
MKLHLRLATKKQDEQSLGEMKTINVKKIRLLLCSLAGFVGILRAQEWQMQPIPIPTRWDVVVSPTNCLTAYPRPQLVRLQWANLNGLWNYAITEKDASPPAKFDGTILVPYPLESALSGIKKPLLPNQALWYKRSFDPTPLKPGDRLLLHFGAIDWQSTVYVNGKEVGRHKGGYTNFTFDITPHLKRGPNELLIRVFDPSDQGVGPHGKQVLNPQNIYYTATSGIWQTVWLETVPQYYIKGLELTPDIDKGMLNIVALMDGAPNDYKVEAEASIGDTIVSDKIITNVDYALPVPNAHLWSPADPYLYDLTVKLYYKGKLMDQVHSYFGMRKISIAKDDKGIDRIFLNNHPYYNLGVLDQGFWPDGLYTAPTDEALAFDIKAIKAMGFNTIRKHIKVEPARWYYWADKLGMLVWQDMVNPNQGLPEGAEVAFEQQAKETLEQLHNFPCITTWVLFNEKWGAYDQQRLTEWVKATDPSRLVDGHSGELLYVNDQLRSPSPNAYVSADLTDVHSYPGPKMPIRQPGKAQVLGEFGGIGVFIPDHQWNTASAWGYIQEKPADLVTKYRVMVQQLELLQRQGLSGSIYTQPVDVEGEQNGLLTYDREVVKIPFAELRRLHIRLNPDQGPLPVVYAEDADLTDPSKRYADFLEQYIDGKTDRTFLKRLLQAALEAGDKADAEAIGSVWAATLLTPLSDEDIQLLAQVTQSTSDSGFVRMCRDSAAFRRVLGDRPYTVCLMNAIFTGHIASTLSLTTDPDWAMIGEQVKTYGPAGQEIWLRAETIDALNKKDWNRYVPAVKAYLNGYGKNLKANEKQMFQDTLDAHRSP